MADEQITQYLQSLGLPTTNLPVQPGLNAWQLIMELAIQKYIADLQNKQAQQQMEVQLGQSPGTFVGYELFKRGLEKQGKTPFTGPSMSDSLIQQAYNQALGFGPGNPAIKNSDPRAEPGKGVPGSKFPAGSASNYQEPNRATLGTGQFGVPIYAPGEISRQNYLSMSKGEQDLLGSFLQAGINRGGTFTQIDPTDYMQQVQKGFIPTLSEAGPVMQYG